MIRTHTVRIARNVFAKLCFYFPTHLDLDMELFDETGVSNLSYPVPADDASYIADSFIGLLERRVAAGNKPFLAQVRTTAFSCEAFCCQYQGFVCVRNSFLITITTFRTSQPRK